VPEAQIHFLDLAPAGIFVMAVGVAYCALFAKVMLPGSELPETDSSSEEVVAPPGYIPRGEAVE